LEWLTFRPFAFSTDRHLLFKTVTVPSNPRTSARVVAPRRKDLRVL
jgi:hypothetical protein